MMLSGIRAAASLTSFASMVVALLKNLAPMIPMVIRFHICVAQRVLVEAHRVGALEWLDSVDVLGAICRGSCHRRFLPIQGIWCNQS
jgi:hypothetical protein